MTPEEIPIWAPFLKRIPLFSGLSAGDLWRIALCLQPLSLPKGSTLFSQGDDPDALYIVTSGQVNVINTAKGMETVSAVVGRGETLGEAGVLTGEARTTTIRLVTTCEFLKLPRVDFEEILRDNPTILLHLSRLLVNRLRESHRGPERRLDRPQLIAVNAALGKGDRILFTLHLALQLLEQTRRRTLLVDMNPDAGAIARALGVKPVIATEQALREINFREPARLRTLAQQHPSGLEIFNLPASALAGRLYSGIYLFLNFLRDTHDLVLVGLGGELGDVEKSVLTEADTALLAGAGSNRPQFRQLEAELLSIADPKKVQCLWLGEHDAEEGLTISRQSQAIPWSEGIAERFELSGSPFEALDIHPKARRAMERLARRLGKVQLGLAFGTGAALGHFHVGVLKAFKKEGIPIDLISGTSIGALMAGFYALGLEPEEMEEIAVGVDRGWVYENLFWDLTLPRSGLFAGQTLLRFLRSYFGTREFSDMEIPFRCVAADIETGEEVVLKEGRVAEAIRASCGLPLVFAPIRLAGRYLVDGGLVAPVPTKALSEMGADILVAVNLTMPAGDRNDRRRKAGPSLPMGLESLKELTLPDALKAPNMVQVFFQMIYTMEYEIARATMAPAHVLMHPDLKGFRWTELHRARELIRAGELMAEQYVPQIKALIPYFSNYCQMPVRLSSPWSP
ncbi:MAG: patatin-like phospholipase family protein [Elusimicrobia bacterium]|nr:patatin-like phospholipase family protein [Elusimicrobiota bacterium]